MIQQYLAVIGRVPWLIGGDWNIQPGQLSNFWSKGGNQLHIKGPTQKHGSNLDWFLAAKELNLSKAIGRVIVGTDHVAVETTMGGAQSKTLGYRMVGPAGFDPVKLKELAKGRGQKAPAPPTNWTTWTRKAEAWLREQMPEQAKGNKGRGRMPVFKAQTISRPQIGEGAYGANIRIRNLRLKQARI